VIVFFDEMDSIFRTRGTGVSSDVETTVVPQLLSEIDGVEGLENVIVIGASNREDMIDPAILRPGRLDVKIKIERPDAEAAQDIYSKYLTEDLPVHADDLAEFDSDRTACIQAMIVKVVDRMYAEIDDNRFLEVTYAKGDDPERGGPRQEVRDQVFAGNRAARSSHSAPARLDRR
jgi:proteasome-associated ATPase